MSLIDSKTRRKVFLNRTFQNYSSTHTSARLGMRVFSKLRWVIKAQLLPDPIFLVCSGMKHQAFLVLVAIVYSSLGQHLSYELVTVARFSGQK